MSDRLELDQYPPVSWEDVRAVYSDGGCVKVNPSPYAGTWAVVYVAADGREVGHVSGFLEPATAQGIETVENNLMETLAALVGLEVMPDGWDGILFTDSLNALRRIVTPKKTSFNGPASELRERCVAVRERMPKMTAELLCGHPTQEELRKGRGKRGYRVSVHNVRANSLCNQAAARFMAERGL